MSVFCNDIEDWVGRGGIGIRSKRRTVCVYIQLIHMGVQQKLKQYYKAIILQWGHGGTLNEKKKDAKYSSLMKISLSRSTRKIVLQTE